MIYLVRRNDEQHWSEEIPKYTTPDGKARVTVWAGEFEGQRGLQPPPHSYAADPNSEVAIWFIEIQPGGRVTLPAAAGGNAINRRMYYIEGEGLAVDGESMRQKTEITLNAGQPVEVANIHAAKSLEVLVLQGRPIGEPVAQHGPFVMNTMEEIQQAFMDYRRTQFGGWPWPQDAMAFPATKGRFALQGGRETYPPVAPTTAADTGSAVDKEL